MEATPIKPAFGSWGQEDYFKAPGLQREFLGYSVRSCLKNKTTYTETS